MKGYLLFDGYSFTNYSIKYDVINDDEVHYLRVEFEIYEGTRNVGDLSITLFDRKNSIFDLSMFREYGLPEHCYKILKRVWSPCMHRGIEIERALSIEEVLCESLINERIQNEVIKYVWSNYKENINVNTV